MIDQIRRHRRFCALLLLLQLPACYRWELAATSPVRQEDVPPGKLKVTQNDGSRLVLYRTTVRSDTLYGFPRYSSGIQHQRQVPLADIRWVDASRPKVAESVALGLGLALTFGLFLGCAMTDCMSWDWGEGGGLFE